MLFHDMGWYQNDHAYTTKEFICGVIFEYIWFILCAIIAWYFSKFLPVNLKLWFGWVCGLATYLFCYHFIIMMLKIIDRRWKPLT
jgi:uncharacterized membrane protein YagU involved in acid resistance